MKSTFSNTSWVFYATQPLFFLTGFFSTAMTASGLYLTGYLPEEMFLSKTIIAWLIAIAIQLPVTLTYLKYSVSDIGGDE